MFLVNYVNPLLGDNEVPVLVKLRCCEVITKYRHIQISPNNLQSIGQGVYGCLISDIPPKNDCINTFLQIYAIEAFNSLLRYDSIINFTSPFLKIILQVYTSLLELDIGLIKYL